MIAIPALLLITVAVTIGLYLGLLYLRGVRPRRILLGAHILLGMGGLEQLAIFIRGSTPSGATVNVGSFGTAAAELFALAMLSGFIAPLLGQHSRRNGEYMLAAHAFTGAAGFVLFLIWISNI
jgi:hypothetical protein